MNDLGNAFKGAIGIIILFFVLGFLFKVLFKIGLLLLVGLGVLYLYKQVFSDNKRKY